MVMTEDTQFERLLKVDVNDKVKTKQKQKYLSWTYAWEKFKTECPDADYKIIKQENGAPYFADDFGIMIQTEITVNGETKSMWLPVLDGANNAMKKARYSYQVIKWKGVYPYKTKDGFEEKWVEAATMFDINTTTMRCLVKNMAMFGFSLYLYSGEDAPRADTINSSQITEITKMCSELKVDLISVNQSWSINKLSELYSINFDKTIEWIKEKSK